MLVVNDFECVVHGPFEELTDGNVQKTKCPTCGKSSKKIFTKAPPYHMNIETWVDNQRGHLGFKIKESMRREQAMKAQVQRNRALSRRGAERIQK